MLPHTDTQVHTAAECDRFLEALRLLASCTSDRTSPLDVVRGFEAIDYMLEVDAQDSARERVLELLGLEDD